MGAVRDDNHSFSLRSNQEKNRTILIVGFKSENFKTQRRQFRRGEEV
jgi:hypothetical protein